MVLSNSKRSERSLLFCQGRFRRLTSKVKSWLFSFFISLTKITTFSTHFLCTFHKSFLSNFDRWWTDRGKSGGEGRAVKFSMSCELHQLGAASCQIFIGELQLRQLSSSQACQILCELQRTTATFLPRRELSKFDFFIKLCYNIIRKRKDKF